MIIESICCSWDSVGQDAGELKICDNDRLRIQGNGETYDPSDIPVSIPEGVPKRSKG